MHMQASDVELIVVTATYSIEERGTKVCLLTTIQMNTKALVTFGF